MLDHDRYLDRLADRAFDDSTFALADVGPLAARMAAYEHFALTGVDASASLVSGDDALLASAAIDEASL